MSGARVHSLTWLLSLLALLACTSPGRAAADLAEPEVAVETGRTALRSGWSYPWYDKQSDSLARVEVKPPPKPKPARTSNSNWSLGIGLSELIAGLGWVFIGLVLAVAAYLLITTYLESESSGASSAAEAEAQRAAAAIERVEALPVQVRDPHADFLEEARRQYGEGNLAEAIIYLFSYQLLELDRHHLLHLTKGKTNRQYLREIRRNEASPGVPLANLLQQTMLVFEQTFFGGRVPSRAEFQLCWSGVEAFRGQLAKAEGGNS